MGVANIDRLELVNDTSLLQRIMGIGKSGIICIPSQQTAKQAHVGSLAGVGGRERTRPIHFDKHSFNPSSHQIATDPSDPKRCRTVATGGPSHHRTNHVIENRNIGHPNASHGLCKIGGNGSTTTYPLVPIASASFVLDSEPIKYHLLL
jgi:hypothetical protein